ncbi:hypothetical protein XELAEV_18028337mg [Xenopus laevis]|uniref:G-protein coupled receptors family 3 profile domain-containing protein n=1 Tax=Xenopus laevis TaxID=8355 RepID=A0A974HKL2_XENLA|nr:hypothetical protein XELAEV_18028337mg [Xenopus laevis]
MLILTVFLYISMASDAQLCLSSACALRTHTYTTDVEPGHLVIAAFLQLHDFYTTNVFDFTSEPWKSFCELPKFRYYRHYLAFIFAVEEINSSFWILPNITLGYQIFDSCASRPRSLSGALQAISGKQQTVPNFNCWGNSTVVGIVGDLSSCTSYSIAQLVGVFSYPQISYGSMDPVFNDRIQFPSFYRTIPNEEAEIDGIVQILKHFGWKWVGLIISDDDIGYRARERISTELSHSGGCLAFSAVIKFPQMCHKEIEKTTANLWITSSFIYNFIMFNEQKMKFQLNGSFSLLIEEGEIPDFEQFFYSFSPNDYPNNALIASTWQDMVGCFSNDIPSLPGAIPDETVKTCTGNETLSDADLSVFVRNVTFATFPNVTHSFNKYGDPPAQFDIINWLFIPGHEIVTTTVGDFNASDHKILFYIKSISDLWGSQFNMSPLSLCNEPCALGHRKSKKEGVPSCCYDCVPCVDGEMSNTTDAPSCFKCPGYEMSNKNRTGCVPKMINYLSYEDTLGASLASTALMLFITTSAVQGIFVKYWDTPIVKANNQSLSCLLLISLMLCFLCTLLFIGRPTPICCLLRQVTFGIVFTISVSSVLAKTLTVIIAFNATKPGSKLKKYVGYKVAFVLVTICSLGSSGICFVWMTFDPPFLEASMFSQRDIIILMCNEGSVTFFFCIIGYIGTLALLSFIAAFLAKDFPDRFNEAKNITFSMLVFCSVWVTFVPAYLSSKGSRMVAVEIFAILSSSAGLLGCIFAPKCYIIFLRPELNTRVAVV